MLEKEINKKRCKTKTDTKTKTKKGDKDFLNHEVGMAMMPA